MRPPHRILHRNHVHHLAAQHLQEHLQFKDYKRKTSAQVLWSLLLAAAARITSLSDACGRLDRAPSDETARKALWATLPDYATLQPGPPCPTTPLCNGSSTPRWPGTCPSRCARGSSGWRST